MVRTAVAVAVFLVCASAEAAPITLICSGEISFDGKTSPIQDETAIVDIEKRSLKPPVYPSFPITRVEENSLDFAFENSATSLWGTLDRVSGSLTLNSMTPADRQKLAAGAPVKFLSFLNARCKPAQRLF